MDAGALALTVSAVICCGSKGEKTSKNISFALKKKKEKEKHAPCRSLKQTLSSMKVSFCSLNVLSKPRYGALLIFLKRRGVEVLPAFVLMFTDVAQGGKKGMAAAETRQALLSRRDKLCYNNAVHVLFLGEIR